jgi:hypothetical protein
VIDHRGLKARKRLLKVLRAADLQSLTGEYNADRWTLERRILAHWEHDKIRKLIEHVVNSAEDKP